MQSVLAPASRDDSRSALVDLGAVGAERRGQGGGGPALWPLVQASGWPGRLAGGPKTCGSALQSGAWLAGKQRPNLWNKFRRDGHKGNVLGLTRRLDVGKLLILGL